MVSTVLTYKGDNNEPYEASGKSLIAEWSEAGLILLQTDLVSGKVDAAEILQVDWEKLFDDEGRLASASTLWHRTDIPLILVSSGLRASIVPQELWDAAAAEQEFSFWHGRLAQQHNFAHPTDNRIMVQWEIPEKVWKLFTERFSMVTARHILHAMLDRPLFHNDQCQLVAVNNNAWICLHQDQKLKLAQAIPLSAENSFAYSLLDRCRIHGCDPETLPLIIGGRLAKDGKVLSQMHRFFGNIEWSHRHDLLEGELPVYFIDYLLHFNGSAVRV